MILYDEETRELIVNGKVIFKTMNIFESVKLTYHEEFIIINFNGDFKNYRIYNTKKEILYKKGFICFEDNNTDTYVFSVFEDNKEQIIYGNERYICEENRPISTIENYYIYTKTQLRIVEENKKRFMSINNYTNNLYLLSNGCVKDTKMKLQFFSKNTLRFATEHHTHELIFIFNDKKEISKKIRSDREKIYDIFENKTYELKTLFKSKWDQIKGKNLSIKSIDFINDVFLLGIEPFYDSKYLQVCAFDTNTNIIKNFELPNNLCKTIQTFVKEDNIIFRIQEKKNILGCVDTINKKVIVSNREDTNNIQEINGMLIINIGSVVGTNTTCEITIKDNKLETNIIEGYFNNNFIINRNKLFIMNEAYSIMENNISASGFSYDTFTRIGNKKVIFLYNYQKNKIRYIELNEKTKMVEYISPEIYEDITKLRSNIYSTFINQSILADLYDKINVMTEDEKIEYSIINSFC